MLECIGDERSEQIDIIPAKVQVLRHIRLKYACPCCKAHVALAEKPAQILPKSNAAPSLLRISPAPSTSMDCRSMPGEAIPASWPAPAAGHHRQLDDQAG